MSWTKRVQHPSEVVKKGDEVDVLILNVDAENKRISLGLKRRRKIRGCGSVRPIRSVPSCGVESCGSWTRASWSTSAATSRASCRCRSLEIPDIQQPGDAVKEGQAVELKVLEVDPIHHRIVLAATGFPKDDIIPVPAPAPVTEETPEVDADA